LCDTAAVLRACNAKRKTKHALDFTEFRLSTRRWKSSLENAPEGEWVERSSPEDLAFSCFLGLNRSCQQTADMTTCLPQRRAVLWKGQLGSNPPEGKGLRKPPLAVPIFS